MGKCAICRRQDVRYSIEHVIPEALGGYYTHSDPVCVDCNSQLGQRVDGALVNHWLTKLFRFVHNLRGKAKEPPNPFAGNLTLQGDPGRKMQIRIGRDRRLIPYAIPQVKSRDLDADRVQVDISVDASDEAYLDIIVRKIARRTGVSAALILAHAKRTKVSSHNGLVGQRTIDTRNFKIGLLKIAYEFACERAPGYVDSNDAIHAADVLREARFEHVERYVNIGDGFDQRILAPFSDFLGFQGLRHYLVLCGTDGGLLCFVHLHQLFSVGVTLSAEPSGEFVEFGVNDVEARSFKVWRPEDLPVTTRYRPLLRFETERQAAAFREAERSPSFDYESADGSWKLFGPGGTDLGLNVDQFVAGLEPVRSDMEAGLLVDDYQLPEGIYHLQPRASDPVPVLGFRAEHGWEKL